MNKKTTTHTTIDINFDKEHIWHPYTSMTNPLPCYPVKSAEGVYIELEDGTKLIDGMSSWWSVIHGYNNEHINEAISSQLKKMSHVMFGGLTHEPAVNLAKHLVELTPDGLNKVFLADSGSVSIEVALKMAIQYQLGKGHIGRNRFIALKHGYHGDTFGAMAVCDPLNSMHSLYSGMMPQNYFIDSPTSKPTDSFQHNELAELADVLECRSDTVAALIIEPIVQGAGGMRFYHPDYLSGAKKLCEKYGVLLIADEIATGFGRTGKMFACEHANITPDILCVGKAITGGYMTLAAAICTDEVAITLSNSRAGVLMHGPTFMGNPLACAAANASMELLKAGTWENQVKNINRILNQELNSANQLERVTEARVFGAIGVIEMKEAVDVASIQKQFVDKGIWVRPFGKLIYVMPPYIISEIELTELLQKMLLVVKSL
ncbi:adenosylmethionine--8-amino-7-oxononanoate transaminase [Psychrosphaera aestuarii]|uniref:adenosylmethionine--8-amino-7-oxononanoate transaminase n=1 Tax=Psychrosphaera aestuarii TaxID=1266052 RepID=UPI001B33ECDA|nr:adenosylmethionine--8-amino-7-oxononanoate transaminase [Psychrosphaera aestuarii]